MYACPERLCGVYCMQARYSKSVEGVVGALVDDTVALNKTTRQVEGLVKHQQMQLQDTKEALLRWVSQAGENMRHDFAFGCSCPALTGEA